VAGGRRSRLLALAVVAALVAGALAWRLDVLGTRRSPRPNIVLILTDDQRWDSMGVMPEVRSLLGGHGVTFANSFVTTSLCCPSRATILTGQYSRHTGVYQNTPPHGGATSFRDRSTVATWLHGAGYQTALVGKYLNEYNRLPTGYVPPGWDEWDAIAQRRQVQYYNYDLNENGRIVHFGGKPADYSTDVLAAKATQFALRASRPFFLYFAPIAPHEAAVPAPEDAKAYANLAPLRPPSYDEPDARDKPWAAEFPRLSPAAGAEIDLTRTHMLESLRAVDRAVAALVQALQTRGALGDTVILFASDNGFLWGEHRLRGKIWPYEESIRVPLVIRVPWLDRGLVDRHLVTNADYASTIADLAGTKPGLPQDGRSLVPLLRGRDPPWPASILVEYLGATGADRFGPPPFEAIRTERYLYVEYDFGWRELYDLKKDPYELDNLAGQRSTAALEARLAAALPGLLGR